MAQQRSKPFHIAFLREITDQYDDEEISYSKFVELLNDVAIRWHQSVIAEDTPAISKMETTQTAVDWLVEQVNSDCLNSTYIHPKLVEEAKQMERQQLSDAMMHALDEDGHTGKAKMYIFVQNYYNEKFK